MKWLMLFGLFAAVQAKRTIEVPLAMSQAKAVEQIQLKGTRQDLVIASNQGGVIQFEPQRVRKNNPTTVTLRVTVLSTSDSTSVAVVSGRWYSPMTAMMQRRTVGPDNTMDKASGEPVEEAVKGWRAELWNVVKAFADSIG